MQMMDAVRNAFRLPDLRRKLLYTLFILLIYQFAVHIPVPGVDRTALNTAINGQSSGILLALNLLSGGAVSQMSILAMGVYPYITAQIILQLLTGVIPQLEAISREPRAAADVNLAHPISDTYFTLHRRGAKQDDAKEIKIGRDICVTVDHYRTVTVFRLALLRATFAPFLLR